MSASDPEPRQAICLYCLVDASLLNDGMVDVDDEAPVLVLPFGDVAAVVRAVPLADFCGDQAAKHLRDLAWLGPMACRHQAVIDRAMRFSPAFPLGFGTLFSSLAEIESFVWINRAAVRGFLDEIDGKEEWAIRAHLVQDHPAAIETLAAEQYPELAASPPGTRYLLLLRRYPLLAELHRVRATAEADRVMAELAALAHAFRDLPLRPGSEPSGRSILRNCAALVEACAAPRLRQEVDRLGKASAGLGLDFALSGPWPPFSFRPALAPTDGMVMSKGSP